MATDAIDAAHVCDVAAMPLIHPLTPDLVSGPIADGSTSFAPRLLENTSAAPTADPPTEVSAAPMVLDNAAPPLLPAPRPSDPTYLPPPPGAIAVPDIDMESVCIPETQKKAPKRKASNPAGGAAKHRKTGRKGRIASSSNVDASVSNAKSTSSPSWVSNATTLFKSTNLGSEWDLLLSTWLEFEERAGFDSSARLGAQHRPRAIADWIQRARPATFRPEIKDEKEFAAAFSSWWQNLQPEWRRVENNNGPQEDEDWDAIRCSGVNGLVSVVAALFFWGSAIQDRPTQTTWLEAVKDVSYVLHQLL